MKKIIALVLFATMLFAMVPAASAASNAYNVTVRTGDTSPWYAKQKSETLDIGTDTNGTGYIGVKNDDGDNLKVKVESNNKTRAASVSGEDIDTTTITITIKGSYKDAQSFYYSTYANSINYNYWGKAVKIPYIVTDENKVDITGDALLDGAKNLNYQLYNGTPIYYIDFVLTEEDRTDTHYITYSNNLKRVAVKIVWDNTDGDKDTPDVWPTLKVMGYDTSAAQYGNYTASFISQMVWDEDDEETKIGRLVFNIAAQTQEDRYKIWKAANPLTNYSVLYGTNNTWDSTNVASLNDLLGYLAEGENNSLSIRRFVVVDKVTYYQDSVTASAWRTYARANDVYVELKVSGKSYIYASENDTMDIRVKAFDTAGNAYPAGTLVAVGEYEGASLSYYVGGVYNWDEYLGKSNKYVSVSGDPTYVIDQSNCFVFSVGDIAGFAMAAGNYKEGQNVGVGTSWYKTTNDEDILLLYKRYISSIQLIFTTGKTIEYVEFDVYFKNVERSTSSITIIGDNEITIEVGSSVNLPYTFSDAYAMTKDLDEVWKSINTSIVKVTDKENGVVKGVAVGTTYVYCVDASENPQIFVVHVVDKIVEEVVTETTPTETVSYNTYVVTGSNLNVRTSPSTSGKILGKLSRGTEVAGIEIEGSSWVLINYNGTEAYVSGKYLAEK